MTVEIQIVFSLLLVMIVVVIMFAALWWSHMDAVKDIKVELTRLRDMIDGLSDDVRDTYNLQLDVLKLKDDLLDRVFIEAVDEEEEKE